MPTLIDRLRAGADSIHSIGPARAADLLREAADALAVLSERAATTRRLELVRAPPAVYRVEPPGKLLHKHLWNESGDGCWDCLLALGRAGTPVYRLPDLNTDVALTFPRELLEGLVLEVREVDGKQIGYLRLVLPEDLSTPIGAPSLAVAEQFDAEACAAAEDPGTPGEEAERFQGLDDSDRE